MISPSYEDRYNPRVGTLQLDLLKFCSYKVIFLNEKSWKCKESHNIIVIISVLSVIHEDWVPNKNVQYHLGCLIHCSRCEKKEAIFLSLVNMNQLTTPKLKIKSVPKH